MNEDRGRFRMGIQSSMNCTNFERLNIKKFRLMSRGLNEARLRIKMSDAKDFVNFVQPVAGYGNAPVDNPPTSVLVFNHLAIRFTLLNCFEETQRSEFNWGDFTI